MQTVPDVRLTGVVRTWGDRGCGFINSDSGRSVFVHIRDVEPPRELAPGERVAFEIATTPDGRERAVRVRVT